MAAVERGELDDVDRVARWLGRAATPAQLRALLAGDVVPRLAAAAHAPIFLFELPRVAPRGEVTGELLRGLARSWGGHPSGASTGSTRVTAPGTRRLSGDADAMFAALAATPLGTAAPGDSPFIYPVMSRVDSRDRAGVAASLLDPLTGGRDVAARAAVLRAAAWSMLLEPGDHVPYGWSHCLTMPQAVLGLTDVVDPSTALAVASTFVVGFRSAFAVRPLEPVFPHDDPGLTVADAIDAGPDAAAAAVWHHADPASPEVVGELATRASVQGDADLVKYTLACLDAAADDRRARPAVPRGRRIAQRMVGAARGRAHARLIRGADRADPAAAPCRRPFHHGHACASRTGTTRVGAWPSGSGRWRPTSRWSSACRGVGCRSRSRSPTRSTHPST